MIDRLPMSEEVNWDCSAGDSLRVVGSHNILQQIQQVLDFVHLNHRVRFLASGLEWGNVTIICELNALKP